jgi:hypothetical protein
MLARVLRADVTWTAIDHANAKDALTGAIRKARGVKPGLPDYLFLSNGRAYFIEFKTKGTLSDNQRAFHADLTAACVPVATCRGEWEVFDQVKAWGLTRPLSVAA